ncbi:MAG: prenyltransferase/squalene oxidase repeat-containing protein [Planctomycetota bacterium]
MTSPRSLAIVILLTLPGWAGERDELIAELRKGDVNPWRIARDLRAHGDSIYEEVVPFLVDRRDLVRDAAALTIGELELSAERVDRTAKILGRALKDPDEVVRGAAIALLSQGGDATRTLLVRIARGQNAAADPAADALVRAGAAAVPQMQKLLQVRSAEDVLVALRIVRRIGPPAASLRHLLVPLIEMDDTEIRSRALLASAAAAEETEQRATVIASALMDRSPFVVARIVREAALAGGDSVPFLLDARAKADNAHRWRYERAIANIGPAAVKPLEAALGSESDAVALRILSLMRRPRLSESSWARVREEAASEDEGRRRMAAQLCARGDAPVPAKLLDRLESDESVAVRAWALAARARTASDPGSLAKARLALLDKSRSADAIAAAGGMVLHAPESIRILDIGAKGDGRAAAAAIAAFGRFEASYVPGSPAMRAERMRKFRKVTDKACAWLADAQGADGLWSAEAHGGHPQGDVGVTALALMAFSAAGHADSVGPWAGTIRRGLEALVRRQDDEGHIGNPKRHQFFVQHCLATVALADAQVVGATKRDRGPLARAAKVIEDWRNPSDAWRYQRRGGENDTFCTTWAAYALASAQRAGIPMSNAARRGTIRWFDKMTDDELGTVGYNSAGTFSSRIDSPRELTTLGSPSNSRGHAAFPPQEVYAMVAAGLWTRGFLDDEGGDSDRADKSWKLILRSLADWRQKSQARVDLFFWHFTACAANWDHMRSGKRNRRVDRWIDQLRRMLTTRQLESGSWDPVGAWGKQGGRVYSTSMALLAFTGTDLFGSDLEWGDRRAPTPYKIARRVLEAARESDSFRLAFEAHLAALSRH